MDGRTKGREGTGKGTKQGNAEEQRQEGEKAGGQVIIENIRKVSSVASWVSTLHLVSAAVVLSCDLKPRSMPFRAVNRSIPDSESPALREPAVTLQEAQRGSVRGVQDTLEHGLM